MRLHNLITALHTLAPPHLAGEWDNVGLILGDHAADTARSTILLTIDCTEAVAEEAVELDAAAVVAYHPPIFAPIKRLTDTTREGRVALALLRNNIAVYSPHTAIDAAPQGVADWLMDITTNRDERPGSRRAIETHHHTDHTQTHKLVFFIPPKHADACVAALADAGAGIIGDYTRCTYRSAGEGSFLPGTAANPTIGSPGNNETVEELRIETVAPTHTLPDIIRALRHAHPYEEPAFDIYRREPTPEIALGPGREATLTKPTTADQLAERLKHALNIDAIRVAADPDHPIENVAVCPGAGSSVLFNSPAFKSAERTPGPANLALITGEMRHHDVLRARAAGTALILAGHTNTERPYLPILKDRLAAELTTLGEPDANILISTKDTWPLRHL